MNKMPIFIFSVFLSSIVQAEEGIKPEEATSAPKPIPEAVAFTKDLSGKFNGETIRYRAVAGETYLRDDQERPVASFFTTAYIKSDVKDATTRPVTFIFNGGPGSSSAWLHMGAFGPKRVDIPSEPKDDGAPPYPIVDNTESILDVSDLVFVDPIGTGYSRTLGDTDPKTYWGLMEDATSVADFIQIWITENKRWNSPKYLAGESYGTTRAVLVADILSSRMIALNGIALISAVLDYQNSRPHDGGIMAYASFLPTMAATAWYHNKIDHQGKTLADFLDEAREFARTEYPVALIAGNRLTPEKRQEMVTRLAAFTGLSEAYIDHSNLRILVNRFYKEFLRNDKTVIGRLDGRYTGVESDNVGEFAESDPTFDAIGDSFNTAINTHLTETLSVNLQRPYKILGGVELSQNWNWSIDEKTPSGGRFINVIPSLGRTMRHNKDLRILVASGYYDFATPFFGAENALAEDGLVPDHIQYTYYKTGHMIFLDKVSRVNFLKDIHDFITESGQ